MPVIQITAWKTSTGQCFDNKSQAYHEEMVWLLRTQSDVNRKGFDTSTFEAAVQQQKVLVAALQSLRDGLNPKRDARVIEEIGGLLLSADGWLQDAQSLQDLLDGKVPADRETAGTETKK